MPKTIPQHQHCMICGKAIPADEEVCSESCDEELDSTRRKRRIMQYILYGAVAATTLLILFQGSLI